MLRRLFPLLISLLLLMSQQVALSHGYTHWTPTKAAPVAEQAVAGVAGDNSLVEALCQFCVAAGELAFAITGHPHCIHAEENPSLFISVDPLLPIDRLTTVVFRSRAPPAI